MFAKGWRGCTTVSASVKKSEKYAGVPNRVTDAGKKENMNGNNLAKLSGVLLFALWTSTSIIHAQLPPPDPFAALNTWSFEDTFYVSDNGPEVPLSYTNIS